MFSWQNYKLKLTGVFLILSVYLLLPTFLGLKERREALKEKKLNAPWYFTLLPQKELNLGLDLRGGLYVEMEVNLKEATQHQIDIFIAGLKRYVLKDDYKEAELVQLPNHLIRVIGVSPANTDFQTRLTDYERQLPGYNEEEGQTSRAQRYSKGALSFGVMQLIEEPQEIFFEFKLPVVEARKKALAALKAVAGFTGDAVPIQEDKYLAIPFESEAQKTQIVEVLTAAELGAEFTTSQVPDLFYIQLESAFFKGMEKDIIEQAANAVRNRIDRYGVAEASVSRQSSNRLSVEIPGVKNPDHVIDIIQRTGKLEFRIVNDSVTRTELKSLIQKYKKELGIKVDYEAGALAKLNEALKADLPPDTEVLFSLDRNQQTKKVSNVEPYLVSKKAEVTGDMLANASVQSQGNQPYVSFSFKKAGIKPFGDLTTTNVGKKLAIILDAVVISAPDIKSPITGGEGEITLGYGRYEDLQREAMDIVLVLKEGALPASLVVASKNVIGPSLGHDSIQAGVKSILISALAIFLFMLFYYRKDGLVANTALLLNVLFLFAILCLFQASVTLPGMAGIVLTMGMAVDANVIIFERMREEKMRGVPIRQIVDSGYSDAMSAIVDGNLTTLIAGLVLFEFGTGPIKGFATTLMIGIVTTMFTAIVVTRSIYNWLLDSGRMTRLGF